MVYSFIMEADLFMYGTGMFSDVESASEYSETTTAAASAVSVSISNQWLLVNFDFVNPFEIYHESLLYIFDAVLIFKFNHHVLSIT